MDVHDLGMHDLLIARTITEFFIGILYDIVIWLTDVEEVIWNNRGKIDAMEDREAKE